ncbi:MAG: DNA repair protein RecO [Defluviitaleaceae bacterium]|nr:DNA repair protein RecO [Defluviitaleaceae bacterium]
MSIIKDCGIVLRENIAGETNKRLVLLTKNHGKVVVFARGAKGAKSKLSANKLSYNEFVIYDGGQFFSLTQCSPIVQFANIPLDYNAFCVANFILELSDKIMLENMEALDTLNLVLMAFYRLEKAALPSLVQAVFTLKLLQKEGFFGEHCTENPDFMNISKEANAAINYILSTPIKRVFNFRVSSDVMNELQQYALLFLQQNVDLQLKSLEFF